MSKSLSMNIYDVIDLFLTSCQPIMVADTANRLLFEGEAREYEGESFLISYIQPFINSENVPSLLINVLNE